MDPFHERLARVALDAAGSYGFALAGGYAVQAHGFLDRMSADVDLFAEASGEFDSPEAVGRRHQRLSARRARGSDRGTGGVLRTTRRQVRNGPREG